MYKFLCIVLTFLFMVMSGCSHFTASDPVCDLIPDGQTSTLCTIADAKGWSLDDIALTLKVSNTAALQLDVYKANQALEFIDGLMADMRQFSETGMTAEDLLLYMLGKYDGLPPSIAAMFIIFDDYRLDLGEYGGLRLDPYDFQMLLLHFQKQRQIVLLFG